jgi:phospholipase C
MMVRYARTAALAAGFGVALAAAQAQAQGTQGVDRLSHILVLYMENRSFDNIFGEFPGANGIANAGEAATQKDRDGKPFAVLPEAKGPFHVRANPDPLYGMETLNDLPNRPFRTVGIRPGVTTATHTRDLIHAFYTNRSQIHGGKNDWFALFSNAGGLTMSYYTAEDMKDTSLWKLAQRYTLLDNFFMGTFGGSFLNHIWLVCACAPVWPDAPKSQRSEIDGEGHAIRDRRITAAADGDFAVNTTQSIFLNNGRQGENVLPPQEATTIGDRLTEKGVDWAWYSGGWNVAAKSDRTPEEDQLLRTQAFQWHHQPFAYFARFDPTRQKGRDERTAHLRDASTLEADIKSGKLPPVTFYKPIGVLNQHPGYANLVPGDEEVCGRHHLRRERRTVGSRRAAPGACSRQPRGFLRSRIAHSDPRGVAARPQGARRSYGVRDHLDPEAHRRAAPPRAPAERPLRRGREPREGLRFRPALNPFAWRSTKTPSPNSSRPSSAS